MDTNCDEMPAGRELDALVAERVMGAEPFERDGDGSIRDLRQNDEGKVESFLPYYSTDIAAAWQVVERVTRIPETPDEARQAANARFGRWFDAAHLWADTAQEAALRISRAALKAVAHG